MRTASVVLNLTAVAALVALVLVAAYIPSAAGPAMWVTLAVSVAITAANLRLIRKVRHERQWTDQASGIPGLAGARTERAITGRFEKAASADLWTSAITMATWLVDWHLAAYPSAWTPRIKDLTDGYQPWAVDLVALALVDAARAEHPETADASGIGTAQLDAAAQRLNDPRTAFETLHRATSVPLDTGQRLASLELMSRRLPDSDPAASSVDINGSRIEVWDHQPGHSNEAQEAVLFTIGVARQVLDAHAHQAPHGRLRDRFPALARLEMVQRATDRAPRRGPYKGAPPLTTHRHDAALLAQDLLTERRRTATPAPPSRIREYLLLIAVCEDRAALLWGERPPGEISERAEHAARRLVDWDTSHPSEAPQQEPEQGRADPRAYVRHAYTLAAADRAAGGTDPR